MIKRLAVAPVEARRRRAARQSIRPDGSAAAQYELDQRARSFPSCQTTRSFSRPSNRTFAIERRTRESATGCRSSFARSVRRVRTIALFGPKSRPNEWMTKDVLGFGGCGGRA